MKAVIMAGGKGSRLRPLTCNVPKPMVPLIHKPVMEYSIELLKKHGITDIAVTLQYLPEQIREYFGDGSRFGVNLHYFEETTPLGTAGSIKNAESFLDERFIVISGDALTDFDLSAGIDYHEKKDALVSIFMKQVDSPLEFGVIMTNENGEIIRFLEKPSWSEVFSDTVNTGIYVLEPEIFSYLEEGVQTDFSKDLFPLLMKENKRLFGYQADGYWSDIGNLQQYRQTQYDMLNRKVTVSLPGTEIEPGVWVGEHAIIEKGAKVEAPVSIGPGSFIRKGAQIGEHSIVGRNNVISSGASLKRSVLWSDIYVGDRTELRGTTICNGTRLEEDTSLYEHSVIGDHCTIDKKVTVKPEVKVWPNKEVEESSIVHTSIVWGRKASKTLFSGRGISGLANVEITPDFMARLASACGSVLGQGCKVCVSSDSSEFTQLMKQSFMHGLHSAGISTVDIGPSVTPLLRFVLEHEEMKAGVYFRFANRQNEKQVQIEFFDQKGLHIHPDIQRKIENAYWQEDYRRAAFDYIGKSEVDVTAEDKYIRELLNKIRKHTVQQAGFRIVIDYNLQPYMNVIPRLLKALNCEVFTVPYRMNTSEMTQFVRAVDADLGVLLGESGEFLKLIDEHGQLVDDHIMLALYVLLQFYDGKHDHMAIPVHASDELDELAERLHGKVIRSKADPRSMMETEGTTLSLLFDCQYALIHMLEMMALQKSTVAEIIAQLPTIQVLRESVSCPKQAKGQVMRKLIQDSRDENVELLDGIKVNHPEGGWTLILPDHEEPVFTVYSQGNDLAVARQVSMNYVNKIRKYQQVT
ncbi:sugar phosphate nucleotidyltransferase [Desertibacillus haloalkaliphilus]|uniref:sugar phosphate nucleotidyltransferase n=1 Tax=Desertibacillus haloalkaliphilus TaxID=1328930 RepID=UPI001C25DD78|nr:sugar phosphate nucleotidyltransferase [Desertibacillus haloalkaliphilus]MBU8905720.1 NTP transferase domain-containing protein [Desertibacillus haloalkaliphilus]